MDLWESIEFQDGPLKLDLFSSPFPMSDDPDQFVLLSAYLLSYFCQQLNS